LLRKALPGSGQAGLNRGVALDRLAAPLARWRCVPGRRRVEPDGQRSTLTQRRVVGGPVQGAVAARFRFGHAVQLSRWTREVNPRQASYNNARRSHEREAVGRYGRAPRRTVTCAFRDRHPEHRLRKRGPKLPYATLLQGRGCSPHSGLWLSIGMQVEAWILLKSNGLCVSVVSVI
jgi:hypothetical protein